MSGSQFEFFDTFKKIRYSKPSENVIIRAVFWVVFLISNSNELDFDSKALSTMQITARFQLFYEYFLGLSINLADQV